VRQISKIKNYGFYDRKYSFMNIGQKNSINIHQRSESLCEPPKVSDSVI
jgi:hypothetical protein